MFIGLQWYEFGENCIHQMSLNKNVDSVLVSLKEDHPSIARKVLKEMLYIYMIHVWRLYNLILIYSNFCLMLISKMTPNWI